MTDLELSGFIRVVVSIYRRRDNIHGRIRLYAYHIMIDNQYCWNLHFAPENRDERTWPKEYREKYGRWNNNECRRATAICLELRERLRSTLGAVKKGEQVRA